MKRFKYIIPVLLLVALSFNACNTDSLTDLNQDPTVAAALDPGYIMAYTQLQISGERYENWRAVLIYQSTMIQHFATLATYWAGDKYLYNGSYSASLWDRAFNNYVKDLVNLLVITDPSVEGQEDLVNYHAMARILKVFAFHRLTDHYGDVPYSEAGLGYLDRIFFPTYDAQQDIYFDMLKELDEAGDQLSTTARNPEGQDLFYAGDIAKWKKFANSLMLRLGMRMTKVDAGSAQTWVERAISKGVMDNFDDACFISHTDGPEGINRNGIGEVFLVDDQPRLSKTWVDMMMAKGDPRLDVLSWVSDGTAHQGLPNGLNSTTVLDLDPNYGSGDAYSRPNPLLTTTAAPMIFQTYAEVAFLTAEAVERGWNAGGAVAADEYEKGVRAAMDLYTLYDVNDPTLKIDEGDVDTYLANNPYTSEWERILGEEYWSATFLNEYEAYANWRRTEYPTLVPVDYPGNESNSEIPRRLRYPGGEAAGNPDGYNAAIARQGEDQFWTRMWWDVAN